jgi:hypothetical protein
MEEREVGTPNQFGCQRMRIKIGVNFLKNGIYKSNPSDINHSTMFPSAEIEVRLKIYKWKP